MILSHGLHTKQVDYTNAFCQSDIKKEIYIEPPKVFGGVEKIPKVFRLFENLYGLKRNPKTFFDKFEAGLREKLYTVSN